MSAAPHPMKWNNMTPFGDLDYKQGLREMMDYGAKEFALGHCGALAFSVMGGEVEYVKAHMAEKHPNVPYSITYPRGLSE